MPHTCFSYPSDVPPVTGNRNAVQPAPPGQRSMVGTACFNYPADVPRKMPIGTCFSYPADAQTSARAGVRSMAFSTCFRY
jgi:hypothetical protein